MSSAGCIIMWPHFSYCLVFFQEWELLPFQNSKFNLLIIVINLILHIEGKLTTLEEFRLQREDLLSEILNLEEALMKEKATSKEKDEEIIKRIIMEKTK